MAEVKIKLEDVLIMKLVGREVPGLSNALEVGIVDNRLRLPLLLQLHQTGSFGLGYFIDMWNCHKGWLDSGLHSYGAVLFRGFNISGQLAFESVVELMREHLMDYVDGNSPRTKLGSGIYTSTEYPPDFFISLHNELSYSAQWPAKLFFCCVLAPVEGGETPLVDSRSLLRQLPKYLVEEFRGRQVKYIRNLHSGKGFGPSWQQTFETTDPVHVENYARSSGIDIQWNIDGSVRLSCVRQATTFHPITGEEVWFNQADQFHISTHPKSVYKSIMSVYEGREYLLPQNATFGDDTPIPLEYLETIRTQTRQLLALFRWHVGDLLMVDNVLTAHGRMPYKGPRKILVAMATQ
jgi:Taurine catabolism dioxygenase TauD, TfdA family